MRRGCLFQSKGEKLCTRLLLEEIEDQQVAVGSRERAFQICGEH